MSTCQPHCSGFRVMQDTKSKGAVDSFSEAKENHLNQVCSRGISAQRSGDTIRKVVKVNSELHWRMLEVPELWNVCQREPTQEKEVYCSQQSRKGKAI